MNSQSMGINAINSDLERDKLDLYETPQGFTEALLNVEKFNKEIWEPTAGNMAIVNVLIDNGHQVWPTDILTREMAIHQMDFLGEQPLQYAGKYDIIMNPPFSSLCKFVDIAVQLCHMKVAAVMPISGLTSSERYETLWKKLPIKKFLVCPARQVIKSSRGMINSQFCHMWAIFDKGYVGKPIVEWTPCIRYRGE